MVLHLLSLQVEQAAKECSKATRPGGSPHTVGCLLTPDEFPEQPDLAAKVCAAVRTDLARRDPPLNYIQSLRYFERQADNAYLALPFKYASILQWNDDVDEITTWYGEMLKESGDAHRTLLNRVRGVTSSEHFEYAPCVQVAQVSLVWGGVEEQYGTTEKALAVYEWCLKEVVARHADAGVQAFGEMMKERVKLITDFLAIGSSGAEVDKAGTATTAAAGTAEATQPGETKVVMAKEGSSTV